MHLTQDQIIGADFLANSDRVILADDVGYGKTRQALAALKLLGTRRALYVTGAQAAFQVMEESALINPRSTIRFVQGTKTQRKVYYANPPNITVITYGVLRSDWQVLAQCTWEVIVLDDASAFKNPQSHLARAANQVTRSTDKAWALTATPIENSLVDLWAIFHALNVYPLGSWELFTSRYCEFGTKYIGGRATAQVVRYRNLDDLTVRLRGFVLRRQNVEGPKMTILTHLMGMYPAQLQYYRLARSGGYGNTIHDRFTRCLMMCDTTEFVEHPGVSSKLDFVMQLLNVYTGKVVIYSQWKAVLRHLKDLLTRARIKYVEISGDVSLPQRSENQKLFRENPDYRICLITKAGEQALNLQSAQVMICINRLANPQRMVQVRGRIKRMSSPFDTVYTIDLVIENSVEQRMLSLLQRREQLFQTVFRDTDVTIRLSTSDMEMLLSQDENQTPRLESNDGS